MQAAADAVLHPSMGPDYLHNDVFLLQVQHALWPTEERERTSLLGVSFPPNSAGWPDGPAEKTRDAILLVVILLVPIVMFGVMKKLERIWADAEKEPELAEPENTVQRLGSTYHMEAGPTTVHLTAALNRRPADFADVEPDEGTVLQNVLAGFSTAMAALPDAISFSFITGVSPLNGIWAGCIMGVSAAMVGGRPGMIASASAATAVVLAEISLDKEFGMGPMALCVFIVGIFQVIAAALRLSRFITMIPHSVMLGFVNGLAIVMVRAQLRQYHHKGDGPWIEKEGIISMTITALFAMFAALVWARIPKIGQLFPAPLASLCLTVAFSYALQGVMPRRTLEDVAGSRTFQGGVSSIPPWDFPPQGVDWHSGHMWGKVIWTAFRFAVVGLLESLMTQALIDQITGTSGSMRRECLGQGVGNILSSFFGTQGGCALIAQSLMNVGSGGRSRVSGLVMGITLGLSVLVLAPIMAHIPVAALVGLITLIALNTFAWSSLTLILRINWIDAVVVVLVTVVTVWKDLAIAVIAGLVLNALGFSWHTATHTQVESDARDDRRIITLHGALFFGSAMNYKSKVNPSLIPEEIVILDFSQGSVLDISGSNAIAETRSNLLGAGKTVVVKGLSEEVLAELPPDVLTSTPDRSGSASPEKVMSATTEADPAPQVRP